MPRSAIPDVVIGGAPRSGTTFLCSLLAKHPDVYVAQPFIPEPKVCLTPHPSGDRGFIERYAGFFADAPESTIRVEKTSYYFENEDARARLVRVLPQARFIFILREPVSRAYSNWRWSCRNGLETLPFAQAVEIEGGRHSPFPSDRDYVRPFNYMMRGQYGMFAEAWLRTVGRDRVAFYVMEAALAALEPFVASLQQFIGVEALDWSELVTGKINANEPDCEALDPVLAARLRNYIAPEIHRFADITGIDISIWGY
jgi:Sulfotransferase family